MEVILIGELDILPESGKKIRSVLATLFISGRRFGIPDPDRSLCKAVSPHLSGSDGTGKVIVLFTVTAMEPDLYQ